MQQLSIFVRNEVGALARVTEVLAEAGFNLRAFASYDTPDFSILRVIPDRPEEAFAYMQGQGFFCKLTEVLGIPLEDRPGRLHEVLALLQEKQININYIYSLVLQEEGSQPLMVLATDQLAEAKEVLGR